MDVDNLVIIIVIIVINIQLFLLAHIFVMIRDVKERVGYNYYRLKEVEAIIYQSRGLFYKIYDVQVDKNRVPSLPIEEDNLRWICTYCFKQEDNLMTRLTCSHCGAEREEPIEEMDSHPYFYDGGVSIRPYPDAYPDGLGRQ